MARTPVRVQNQPFGGLNNAGRSRKLPAPVIGQQGPSQALEHFGPGLDPNIARGLNQLQTNIRQALGQSKANPFADGNLLEGVALINGITTIAHGLGKPYRGYAIFRQSMQAIVCELTAGFAAPTSPASTITLYTTVPGIIDLWVYL